MLTLEQVRKSLYDRNLRKVAEATGLSYDTVWRVASGRAPQVSYETVQILSEYLEAGVNEG